MNNERLTAVQEIARKVNLPAIAQKLGLHVAGINTQSPKALCPFHDDHRPSLTFYRSPESGKSYYRCFACDAKGDAFDLVKHLQKCDFPRALEWLASETNTPIPTVKSARISVRERALRTAFEVYKKQTPEERKLLEDWAGRRGFAVDFLRTAEVYGAIDNKLGRTLLLEDREGRDALLTAGLAFVPRRPLHLEIPLRDQIFGNRIIFVVRDHSGNLTGFAGRAPGDETPKYLYPRDFPKSATLYRLDRVRKEAMATSRSKAGSLAFHLYVVEGLVDALRVESLGLSAVAVLGSRLSDQQAGLLLEFAEDIDKSGRALSVHFFLDGDNAGRTGTAACLGTLLPRLRGLRAGFLVDVLESPPKNDPDDFLRPAQSRDDAVNRLGKLSRSAMEFLLAYELGVPHAERLESFYQHASEVARLVAFRNIERRLGAEVWLALRERVELFRGSPEGVAEAQPTERENGDLCEWQSDLAIFLGSPIKDVRRVASGVRKYPAAERGSEARLKHAIRVAKASRQRREVPVDEGSWSRIEAALDVFLPYLCERLAKKAGHIEPLMGVKLPKADGGVRLKALPCPEDLILQQYVLNDLLREYLQCRDFHQHIPAIRYYRTQGLTVATGPQSTRPVSYGSDQVLSFAYQVEMDVVEGIIVRNRDGMFRPFYDCWQEFVAFLQRSVRGMGATALHVARFDIRAYYDRLPRFAVNEALLPGLVEALSLLQNSDELGCHACAEFLASKSDRDEPDKRARTIVDWLCEQSFHYQYLSPADGEPVWAAEVQGVPQGPDLSAYLANIALFPLDRAIAELIHKLGSRSASGSTPVYARYVDDMIVVVEDRAHLKVIRDEIANQLSRLGLELSTKTDPAYELTPEGFDEWLTKGRAVGLGLSGELRETLVTAPLEVIGGLADAGEIDRTNSLHILYDLNLHRPEQTEREKLFEAVAVARRAPELRHNDEGVAASLLWRYLVSAESPPDSADDAAEQMKQLWQRTSPDGSGSTSAPDDPDEANVVKCAGPILAWLDGLQRFLGIRVEFDPALTFAERQTVKKWQQNIARWVRDGLCDAIIKHDPLVMRSLRHMLEVRSVSVELSAERLLERGTASRTARRMRPEATTPIIRRLAVSLLEANGTEGRLSGTVKGGNDLMLLLMHEAIGRLIVCPANPSFDPLEPLRAPLDQGRDGGAIDSPLLFEVLSLWLSDGGGDVGQTESEIEQSAVRAFAAITGAKCVELLARRQRLSRAFLEVNASSEWKLVPVPPGVETPGLVAYGINNRNRLRRRVIHQTPTDAVEFEPALEWEPAEPTKPQQAILAAGHILEPITLDSCASPEERDRHRETMLRWVTRAFRFLSRGWNDGSPRICPQTGANLVGPDIDAPHIEEGATWQFLGYPVNCGLLESQAFVLQPGGYLKSVGVPQNCNRLWQIGTALADRLGYVPASDDVEKLGLRSGVDADGDWAIEKILSYGLLRLRGVIPVPQALLPDGSGLPAPVERVLQQMEGFPGLEATAEARVAAVVAMFADGRAIAKRNELVGNPALCGVAAAMLADMAQCQFGKYEEVAHKLPPPQPLSQLPLLRRPVGAWLQLASRLDTLLLHGLRGPTHETLHAVAAGTRILAIQAMMRAQVVELWAAMSQSDRECAVEQEPNLADWKLDPQSLLHRQQERNQGSPIRYLLKEFIGSTILQGPPGLGSLDEITPLGWVVLLDLLARAAYDENGVDSGPSGNQCVCEEVRAIALDLAIPLVRKGSDSSDPPHKSETNWEDGAPWSDLQPCSSVWDAERTWKAIRVLTQLDNRLGLKVTSCESAVFSLLRIRNNVRQVTASDACHYNMAPWRIVNVFAVGESTNSGTERLPRTGGHDRDCYRWSETWRDGRLLSIGAASSVMAVWAGFDSTPVGIASTPEVLRPDPAPREIPSDRVLENGEHPDRTPDQQGVAAKQPPPAQGDSPRETLQPHDMIERLLERQLVAWRTRAKPETRCARIAILQWDVDESYRHPLYDACLCRNDKGCIDMLRRREQTPSVWTTGRMLMSCAEHRRLSILSAALKACKAFGVDILLLPEYSVRPETIRWLSARMEEPDWSTSIWAGTFRLPPRASPCLAAPAGRFREWSSVLSVLYKFTRLSDAQKARSVDGGESTNTGKAGELEHNVLALGVASGLEIRHRGKKYPAVGLREAFCPDTTRWTPLFSEVPAQFDPRRYVTELICSEVFLLTSPSNLLAMHKAYCDLLRKFGAQADSAVDTKEYRRRLAADIEAFADVTSMATLELTRRSILLVPAMTSRCADYALLGQAGFLASSLVTVFCNAVHADFGHGRSCFIGHDSWDKKQDHNDVGMPTMDPYHGVSPGIYRLGHPDRGWLGNKEQAMVIADVNPDFTADASPRPQTQECPLRLVAHLPIIEFWRSEPKGTPKNTEATAFAEKHAKCRCMTADPAKFSEFVAVAQKLWTAIEAGRDQQYHNTADDDNEDLARSLRTLAEQVKNSPGLTERARTYAQEHMANPNSWPPPAAVDWLWVDLGDPNVVEYPEIDVPAYSRSGGLEQLSDHHE